MALPPHLAEKPPTYRYGGGSIENDDYIWRLQLSAEEEVGCAAKDK